MEVSCCNCVMICDLLGMEKSNEASRPYEALKAERKGCKNNNVIMVISIIKV